MYIFLLSLLISLSAFGQKIDLNSYEKQDSVFYKRNSKTGESIFRDVSYNRKYLNFENNLQNIVYKITRTRTYIDGSEGQKTHIEFSMFSRKSGKAIGAAIKTDKDSVRIVDKMGFSFLEANKFGCCGAENQYDLIRLDDGKIFGFYKGKATILPLDGYGNGIKVFAFEKQGKNRYGTLRYFDSNGGRQEVIVEFSKKPFPHLPWTPEVKVTKNSIEVELDCNDQKFFKLEVPIKNGYFYGNKTVIQKTSIKKPTGCKFDF